MKAGATLTAIAMTGMMMSSGNEAAVGEFRLPPAVQRTLPNGMRIYAIELHELPLVSFEIVVSAGAAQDPRGKEGIAELVADLLRKGTGGRSAREIADAVDFAGGSLDASADQDGTRVTAEFLSGDSALALDLLADTLLHPAFASEEVDRLRSERIGELKAALENPGLLASRRFVEILYGDHPYGHSTAGWETTVATISPDDVRAFYRRHYIPENTILVAAGDFEAPKMLDAIEAKFGAWKAVAEPRDGLAEPARLKKRTVFLIDKPDATQSQIRIGAIGMPRVDPDYAVVQVANTILGGGFTSRLVEEIRVNRGLTYGASSRFFSFVQRGPFLISTFTKNPTTVETIRVALEVLEKFHKEGVTEEEVSKARRYIKGNFAIGLQAPGAIAGAMAEIAFYRLPSDYYDTYLTRIASVTRQEANQAIAKHFPLERLNIVVLGRAAEIRKELGTVGPVTEVPLAAR